MSNIEAQKYCYLQWLQSRGQVWLPRPQAIETAEADATAVHPRMEEADIQVVRLLFITSGPVSAAAELMCQNIFKALKLEQQDYSWLRLNPADTALENALAKLRAKTIVVFGEQGAKQLGYPVDKLPICRQDDGPFQSSQQLLIPSLATMIAKPAQKLAVWQLFQEKLL